MKVGAIAQANQKGQIVIPKDFRDTLGINDSVLLNLVLRGRGIYIYPVDEVIAKIEKESSYVKILQKTQGAWVDDSWDNTYKKRRKIELKASEKRRRTW